MTSRQRTHQITYPERERARQAVTRAIKQGKLIKRKCEVCGNPKTEAHHEDYTKPLQVRWLCHPHHVAAHGCAPEPTPIEVVDPESIRKVMRMLGQRGGQMTSEAKALAARENGKKGGRPRGIKKTLPK